MAAVDTQTVVQPATLGPGIQWMADVFWWFATYLWMVVVIVGFPGNIMSILVSLQKDNRKVSTCLYMAALAFADNNMVLVVAWAYSALFHFDPPSERHMQFMWYIGYTSAISSGFFLAEMSIDRLIAVRFPMSAKTRCTPSKAVRTIACTAVTVAVVNIHVFFVYRHATDLETGETTLQAHFPEYPIVETLVLVFHLACGTLLPFFIIVFCNIWIIVTLRAASKRRQQMGVDKKKQETQESETKYLTRMLIIVCVAYVFASIPYRIFELIIGIPEVRQIYKMAEPYWYYRYNVQYWLLIHIWDWNFAVNFYLYCIGGGKKYRAAVKKLFVSIFCPAKQK